MEVGNQEYVFWAAGSSFAYFWVALCVESYWSWKFLRGLRRKHPEVWELSGRRTIWTDRNLTDAFATIRFLRDRVYLSSEDADGIKFCERFRRPVILSYYVGWSGIPVMILGLASIPLFAD